MPNRDEIRIEGVSAEELLSFPAEEFRDLVLTGKSVVFRIGSAEALGQFSIEDRTLALELAQIEGGGEGVIPTIARIARRVAQREGLEQIEWRVHAIRCANPNLKLRRFLERRGFSIETHPSAGECYLLREEVNSTWD